MHGCLLVAVQVLLLSLLQKSNFLRTEVRPVCDLCCEHGCPLRILQNRILSYSLTITHFLCTQVRPTCDLCCGHGCPHPGRPHPPHVWDIPHGCVWRIALPGRTLGCHSGACVAAWCVDQLQSVRVCMCVCVCQIALVRGAGEGRAYVF